MMGGCCVVEFTQIGIKAQKKKTNALFICISQKDNNNDEQGFLSLFRKILRAILY
jgi:hypothetical protein